MNVFMEIEQAPFNFVHVRSMSFLTLYQHFDASVMFYVLGLEVHPSFVRALPS